MKEIKRKFRKYRFVNFFRLIKKKFKIFKLKKIKRYGGKKVVGINKGNILIRTAILENRPFVAVRYGSSELATTIDAISIELGKRQDIRDKCMISLCRNAGFFPNDKSLAYRYGINQAQLSKEVDLFAIWGMNMEDFIIDAYGKKDSVVCLPRAVEPYYFDEPWSASLKGKKVLVIHPFEESIKKQYSRREKLFKNKDVLPEFELYTLKAVQSSAFCETNFENWFSALNYMYDKAMSMDFDVAIIGCGAYGLPLSCMLKKAGKTVVHMGGATQILFGIKGKRWDNHPVISKLYNEYWIRPSEEETPKKAQEVEGACYW